MSHKKLDKSVKVPAEIDSASTTIDALPEDSQRQVQQFNGLSDEKIDRRFFLKSSAALGLATACASLLTPRITFSESPDKEFEKFIKEAQFYEKLPYKKIRCKLCPRECVIDDRERGYCGVRENRGGTYYTLVYSRPCTLHADPIEKKPFFHFLPGTLAFSIATAGCTFEASICHRKKCLKWPFNIAAIQLPTPTVSLPFFTNIC